MLDLYRWNIYRNKMFFVR